MNINLAIIGYDTIKSRLLINSILNSKVSIDNLYYFSENDFSEKILSDSIDVQSFEITDINIKSKDITIAVFVGNLSNQDDLIDLLHKDGCKVIAPTHSLSFIESYPIVHSNVNIESIDDEGGIILYPTDISLMIAPIVQICREHYGLERIITVINTNFLKSNLGVDELNRNNDSTLEIKIKREISSIVKEKNLNLSITLIPSLDEITNILINAQIDNDFVASDIIMFSKKYGEYQNFETNINKLPQLDSIKDKDLDKIQISRLRIDDSVKHGFNAQLSLVDSNSLFVNNLVTIITALLKRLEKLK